MPARRTLARRIVVPARQPAEQGKESKRKMAQQHDQPRLGRSAASLISPGQGGCCIFNFYTPLSVIDALRH